MSQAQLYVVVESLTPEIADPKVDAVYAVEAAPEPAIVREVQDAIAKIKAIDEALAALGSAFLPGVSGAQYSIPMSAMMLRSSREQIIMDFRERNVDLTCEL